jgi:hypothetical protein
MTKVTNGWQIPNHTTHVLSPLSCLPANHNILGKLNHLTARIPGEVTNKRKR